MRAQRGDARAFETLIEPHVPGVRRLARAFCGNWADADDLAQEALIKAFRSLGRFRGDAALSTWLYTIARSTFIDWRRSKAVRIGALHDELDDNQSTPAVNPQDELLDGKREADRLWAAIDCLDEPFRAVVVLFDIEGFSYERIAEIERVPVGTVRSRLSRGRKRLLALLEQQTTQEREVASGTSVSLASSKPPTGSIPCPS